MTSPAATRGSYESVDTSGAYVEHLLSYVDTASLKPLKIVCTAGNGGAGRVVDLLEPHLPFEFIKLHHEADGHFPNGVPNPMLEENRVASAALVLESGADLGIAWDGDFDRCFFYDHTGEFIEGYYVVGLLASAFLAKGVTKSWFTIPDLPGTPSTLRNLRVVRQSRAKQVTRSSRKPCDGLMLSMVGK